jgi:opacity protein-like surface antigen
MFMKISKLDMMQFCLCTFLCLALSTMAPQPVLAGEQTAGVWQFSGDLYMWAPAIKGETAQGGDIDISFNDIIDNLDLTFMAGLTARKDKFSLLVDVIYMDLEDSSNYTLTRGPLGLRSLSVTNLEMTAWVVTPAAAYNILDTDRIEINVLAGARYLYLETDVDLVREGPLETIRFSPSGSGSVWDGIVGARGKVTLNERWDIPFHFDVGAGDTDLTWQAFGGIEYSFSRLSLVAGYRHLEWDFDDDDTGGDLFDDLYISGPVLGLRYNF